MRIKLCKTLLNIISSYRGSQNCCDTKPFKFQVYRALFSNKNLVKGNRVSFHCLLTVWDARDIIKILVNVSYNLFHTLASFSFKGLRMSYH